MGIITLEKSNYLFWLGRYTERVYTTLKYYFKCTDIMLDSDPDYYARFCEKIGISNTYGTADNFMRIYPFEESDPNSIISNLKRAYDNAIVMRDYIRTDTMAYIQLAIDDIKQAQASEVPLADLMLATDHILAFWGCVNDLIYDVQTRNIIKLGKGIERIDLYLSFDAPLGEIKREYERTKQFLEKSKMRYDESIIHTFDAMINSDNVNYTTARSLLRNLEIFE